MVKPGCKLYYVQTGIRITEIVLTAWHLLKNCLYIIPIFMKGKWICSFLLYRYERGSEKAKLRETDATRRAVVAFGCFGLCTSNSHTRRRSPVPAGLHGSPSGQHPDDGPHSASSKRLKQTKCKCREAILIQSETFFLKKVECSYWFLNSLIFINISWAPILHQAPFLALGKSNKTLRGPDLMHLRSKEILIYILVCCFQTTVCS